MALNTKLQLYRGTLSHLESLASTGAAGVLAWTTDSDELYIDLGSGNPGIGPGNAWQRLAAGNQVWTGQPSTNLSSFTNALVGDLAVTTDNDSTYLLTTYPSTNNSNWTKIATTSGVASVNGQTGVVTLNLDQIPDGVSYARILKAVITDGEFDLAKSHQFGFTNDNLIQPSEMGTWLPNTPYIEGEAIIVSVGSPAYPGVFQAITNGISGASEPSFNNSFKGQVTDEGTSPDLVWEYIGTAIYVSVQWQAGATAHQFVTYIDDSGVVHTAQPSFADISGQLSQTQLPSSIGAGTSLTSFDLGTF